MEAGSRAGTLAVIQLIPLFLGSHLAVAADMTGVSLLTYRRIHGSVGTMAFILCLFHVLVNILKGPTFFFQDPLQLYGFVVSSSTHEGKDAHYKLGDCVTDATHLTQLLWSSETLI